MTASSDHHRPSDSPIDMDHVCFAQTIVPFWFSFADSDTECNHGHHAKDEWLLAASCKEIQSCWKHRFWGSCLAAVDCFESIRSTELISAKEYRSPKWKHLDQRKSHPVFWWVGLDLVSHCLTFHESGNHFDCQRQDLYKTEILPFLQLRVDSLLKPGFGCTDQTSHPLGSVS